MMSFETKDVTKGGLRPVGWWSRRNRTREAQDKARESYFISHPNKKIHKGPR